MPGARYGVEGPEPRRGHLHQTGSFSMTIFGRFFAILMLVASAAHAGAGVRYPAPDAGAGVLHQQDSVLLEEEEEEEDEEPDCE